MIRDIDKFTFDEVVKGISIVDFYTPDCPTCEKLSSVFEKVSTQKADINFFKVDLEDDITLAERFSIDHIPTLIVFKDGERVKTNIGFLDDIQLIEFIESVQVKVSDERL